MKPRLMVIVGPTAVGKTSRAIAVARQLGGVVVSADSRQVYAGMNIGTGTPRAAWLENPHDAFTPESIDGVPHFLLNVRAPDQPLTLADWQQAAFHVIDSLVGSTPVLLVGGTMLYVDSVVRNFAIPAVEPQAALRGALEQLDTAALYQRLVSQDPQASTFIEPHHRQRIIRALEVMEITKQPFSAQRREREPRYHVNLAGLFSTWDSLEEAIARRAEEMLADGLVHETTQLAKRYGADLPLLQTIHYAQALGMSRGELSEAAALQDMTRASMRYARRQMSWWKANKAISWFDPAADELDALVAHLQRSD